MREQEMRQRVFRFLKARMRNMIMPATVGIGLAVGSCTTGTSVYSAPIREDASLGQDVQANADGPVPRQDAQANADARGADGPAADLAPVADVARDTVLPGDVPIYGSDVSLLDLRDAEAVDSGAVDLGQTDSGAVDSATDTMITKYMAPILDAGADGTPVVRYMAQLPDGSSVIAPMYMAPVDTTPIPG